MACSCYWTKALEKSTIAMGQAEKSLELLLGRCCFDLKRGWNRLQMLVHTCLKSLQDTDTQDGSEVCWWRNMGNSLVDMNLITSSSQIHYLIFNCKVGFTHKSIRWGALSAVWTRMVCCNKAEGFTPLQAVPGGTPVCSGKDSWKCGAPLLCSDITLILQEPLKEQTDLLDILILK